MTITELIEYLKTLPGDLPVYFNKDDERGNNFFELDAPIEIAKLQRYKSTFREEFVDRPDGYYFYSMKIYNDSVERLDAFDALVIE